MAKRRRGTAIVDTLDGILVVSQDGKTFLLPGGGAKSNESRMNAALRELTEETGLVPTGCIFLFEYESHTTFHKVFLIKCSGIAKPSHEIRYVTYFTGNNVRLSSGTKAILEKYYAMN